MSICLPSNDFHVTCTGFEYIGSDFGIGSHDQTFVILQIETICNTLFLSFLVTNRCRSIYLHFCDQLFFRQFQFVVNLRKMEQKFTLIRLYYSILKRLRTQISFALRQCAGVILCTLYWTHSARDTVSVSVWCAHGHTLSIPRQMEYWFVRSARRDERRVWVCAVRKCSRKRFKWNDLRFFHCWICCRGVWVNTKEMFFRTKAVTDRSNKTKTKNSRKKNCEFDCDSIVALDLP